MFNEAGKILVVTGMLILISGCATTRKNLDVKSFDEGKKELLETVGKNNIGSESFIIQKLSVSYYLNGENRKFGGNLKHDKNGDILISIRITGGIEVARIYLRKDSVRINDRVNKIYSYGETNKIIEKYGFSYNDIYLLFGDLPEIFNENDIGFCENGFSESNVKYYNGYSISIKIDCNERKVSEFNVQNDKENVLYRINYNKINFGDNYKLAEKVMLNYPKNNFKAEIELRGFKLIDEINMKFKPGKGYKYQILK